MTAFDPYFSTCFAEVRPGSQAHAGSAAAVDLSAQTARLAVTPAPAGRPGGPGLWRVKNMELPPYFQNVRNALIRSGHTPADAYRITWGAIRRWARGGGKAHPEVVAAAQAALADLKAKSAIAHSHSNGGDVAAVELVGPKGFVHGWIKVDGEGHPIAIMSKWAGPAITAPVGSFKPGDKVTVRYGDKLHDATVKKAGKTFDKNGTPHAYHYLSGVDAVGSAVGGDADPITSVQFHNVNRTLAAHGMRPDAAKIAGMTKLQAASVLSGGKPDPKWGRPSGEPYTAAEKRTIEEAQRRFRDEGKPAASRGRAPAPASAKVPHNGWGPDLGKAAHQAGLQQLHADQAFAERNSLSYTEMVRAYKAAHGKNPPKSVIIRWGQSGVSSQERASAWYQAALKAKGGAHSHANSGGAVSSVDLAFTESLHPRVAAGNTGGGRFTKGQQQQAPAKQQPKKPARKPGAKVPPKRPAPRHPSPEGTHLPGGVRPRAQQLRAQADAYRQRAAGLRAEIKAEVAQIHAAVTTQKAAKAASAKATAAAKKAAAAGKVKKASAKPKKATTKKATHHHTIASRAKHIGNMRAKVATKRMQARALDREANKLDRQAAAL